MLFSKTSLVLAAISFASLAQAATVRWGSHGGSGGNGGEGDSHIKCPYVDGYTLKASAFDEYSYLACRFVYLLIFVVFILMLRVL
jgi:hypothetical protein